MKKSPTTSKVTKTTMARRNSGWWLLVAAAVLGVVMLVRLAQLDQLPRVLNRDEAALAYNAWSLLDTGKDEWSRSWPVVFESFGDYKLPGYIYSLVGLFSILPKNEWVVRVPSALAGIWLAGLSSWGIWQLTKRWSWALLTFAVIGVTPFAIFYSRIAFEAHLGLALFASMGALFYLAAKATGRRRVMLDTAASLFGLLAALTYNTPLLLMPFMLPVIIVHRGWRQWRSWGLAVAGLLFVIVLSYWLVLPATAQKSNITIFSDDSVRLLWLTYRDAHPTGLLQIFGNRWLFTIKLMFENMLASIGPWFLIIRGGDHPWHSLSGSGHITWSLYFSAAMGVVGWLSSWLSLRNKSLRKIGSLLAYLSLIGLAPAVVTVDAPHATRSLLYLYTLPIWAILGWWWLASFARGQKSVKSMSVLLGCLVLATFFESSSWLHKYFTWYPTHHPVSLEINFPQTISAANTTYPDQPIAIVDGPGFHYILLAWYLKIEPAYFQKTVVRQLPDRVGLRYGERVGRFHFVGHPDDRTGDEKIVVMRENSTEIEEWEVRAY
jgi:hypothetical protein